MEHEKGLSALREIVHREVCLPEYALHDYLPKLNLNDLWADVEALVQERDDLKAVVAGLAKGRDVTSKSEYRRLSALDPLNLIADYFALRARVQALSDELKAYHDGGVTEDILRRHDGHIKVGHDCEIAVAGTTQKVQAAEARVKELEHPRINTRCPSCGSTTLFIANGGYLTCSLLGCKDPCAINNVTAERERLRESLWELAESMKVGQSVGQQFRFGDDERLKKAQELLK